MLRSMDPIRIFLSSPSDVAEERRTLVALVAEINDVLTFLDPGRNCQLAVQHYATDVYPDIVGSAQQVIDRQMPADYDIHLGIMWRRAGTPTGDAPSGTIHEFNRALEQREKTGKPVIMMYFCQEEVPFPTNVDDIDQLKTVMGFRQRVDSMGLVETYSQRSLFRERVRLGLLKAVRDIVARAEPRAAAPAAPSALPDQLESLCVEYDTVRKEVPSGPARTRRMSKIVENMKSQAPDGRRALANLKSHASAGHRLAAIIVLQLFPSAADLDWLAKRLDPATEKPFIGFHAAKALVQAVRSLPKSDCPALRTAVDEAYALAILNPTDPPRIRVLDSAKKELARNCGVGG
jgi:hypothetical protein